MAAPYTLRSMQPTDYQATIELWNATAGMGKVEPYEDFVGYLQRNPALSPVAISEGAVVGAVLCGHDGRRGYLYHLAVAVTHRNQGIATAMIDWCLARLGSAGLRRCSIHIYTDNAEGLAFWRRAEWRERVDLKVMAFDLKPAPG